MKQPFMVLAFPIAILCSGCGGSGSPSETPAEPPPEKSQAEPLPGAAEGPRLRRTMTASECESSGGSVVGDIGDGAIHRDDYTCPSGAPPAGNITAPPGEPQAVEGAVCCPQ